MGHMIINGNRVKFTDEKNVLTVIRNAGIDIPTLCYHPDVEAYGSCRLCTVEDDRGKTFASCAEVPKDGMVVYTNTERLMHYRQMILELLLASHDRDCTTCSVNADCHLQDLAHRMGVDNVRFKNTKEIHPVDATSPSIIRDQNKCILCGNCIRSCGDIQSVSAIEFAYRGTDALVTPAFNRTLSQTDCVGCGQCRIVCPTAAIKINTNTQQIWDAIQDPNTMVVAQVAPAVRVSLGDKFGLPKGHNVMGSLVSVLHNIGFDEVYDTNYAADLTTLEESAEFLERFTNNENMPLFTSCCPAWVKFCETRHPDLAHHISTCRSPMGMFGAVIQEYFRNSDRLAGKKLVSVAIMPCTAKKGECIRPDNSTFGVQDVDYVLTTEEVYQMVRKSSYEFDKVEIEAPDVPFGIGSGGAQIFGVTGGVTEAVLRRLSKDHHRDAMKAIAESGVRGDDGIKEFSVDYQGHTVNICVVSGLANADKVMNSIRSGEKHYDLVEVMACRRGCIMGGGQTSRSGPRTRIGRMAGIYDIDARLEIKKSDENPTATMLYDGLLKGKVHDLLHRNFDAMKENAPDIAEEYTNIFG